jgi:hypothetical protein
MSAELEFVYQTIVAVAHMAAVELLDSHFM